MAGARVGRGMGRSLGAGLQAGWTMGRAGRGEGSLAAEAQSVAARGAASLDSSRIGGFLAAWASGAEGRGEGSMAEIGRRAGRVFSDQNLCAKEHIFTPKNELKLLTYKGYMIHCCI